LTDSVSKKLGKVIQIDENQIQQHLGELVRGTVEDTLNKLLDVEADQLCKEKRDGKRGTYMKLFQIMRFLFSPVRTQTQDYVIIWSFIPDWIRCFVLSSRLIFFLYIPQPDIF
jgi:hypothetical protein